MDVTLTTLLTAVMLLVPGFVYGRVKRRFCVYAQPEDWQHAVLSYLVHSLVLLAIAWAYMAKTGHDPQSILNHGATAATISRQLIAAPGVWLATIIVFPAAAGWCSALLVAWGAGFWLAKFFRWIHCGWVADHFLQPLPSIVLGWDAMYLQLTKHGPNVVIVKLHDGSVITGMFEGSASTSRSGKYPDLFLSRLCGMKEGEPVPLSQSRGVFVRGAEIVSISLIEPPEDVGHVEGQAQPDAEGGQGHGQA